MEKVLRLAKRSAIEIPLPKEITEKIYHKSRDWNKDQQNNQRST